MTDLHVQQDQTITKGSSTGGEQLLAFDTSTSSMTVALLTGTHLAAERQEVAERNHSIQLFPLVESALQACELAPEQIDAYGVGIGPGSYTGVRIAVTAAKTMAWALAKPVVGVSSLAALALGAVHGTDGEQTAIPLASGETVWIVPLVNARRGQAFTALFAAKLQEGDAADVVAGVTGAARGQGDDQDAEVALDSQASAQGAAADGLVSDGITAQELADDGLAAALFDAVSFSRLSPDAVRLLETWVEDLLALIAEADEPPAGIAFVGEPVGFEPWLDAFAARWTQGRVWVQPLLIRAYHIGRLALNRLHTAGAAAAMAASVHDLVPNYAQLAEAEVNLLAKRREEAR
jgi:tRNA threonylcarbamoyladenosine biosynthesis protein TsaB